MHWSEEEGKIKAVVVSARAVFANYLFIDLGLATRLVDWPDRRTMRFHLGVSNAVPSIVQENL